MPNAFRITRRVQFAETDMAGVLHFANFYRFMEEVEHAFWRSVGLSVMLRDGGKEIGWPRVATRCEYFAPVRFEDEVELILTVTDVGAQSVTYEVEFRQAHRQVARGQMTAVCCAVNDRVFTPIAIPARMRRELEARAGER